MTLAPAVPVLRPDRRPHLSPFRYPGGKSWLLPVTTAWLSQAGAPALLEPFAGGASVTLRAVTDTVVPAARIVELDEGVAAVWAVTLEGDVEQLVDRVLSTGITLDVVDGLRSARPRTQVDLAFATLVRNRTSHGGSLTDRTGTPNRGERGRGLTQRWYPETIASRLRHVATLAPVLRSHRGDGIGALTTAAPGTAVFIDPPYTAGSAVGARLYRHHQLDHERLFALAAVHDGPLLMTYDDNPRVRDLVRRFDLVATAVAMRGNQGNRRELLISRPRDQIDGALAAAAPDTPLF